MDIKDYIFNPGDVVITTEGKGGRITRICDCISCQQRGFYEPFWIEDSDDKYEQCISIYEAKGGFDSFYQIGNYRFSDFDKGSVLQEMASCEKELSRLKRQLAVIEEIENGDNEKDIRIRELEAEVEELRGTLEKAYSVIGQLLEKPNPFTED